MAAADYSDNGISDYGDDDDRSDHLPGFLFAPTDEQLLGFYLRRKTAGGGLAPAIDAIIPTLDIFGPRALPPWLLHPRTAASSFFRHDIPPSVAPRHATDWFYCFAHITPRGSGWCRTTESGTWVSNGKEKRVDRRNGETLGYKSTLVFRIAGEGGSVNSKGVVGTGWVMHEFKIHGPERKKAAAIKRSLDGSNSYSDEAEQLVLCRIRFRCTKPTMEPNAVEGYRPDDGGEVDVCSRRPKRHRTREGPPPESPGARSGPAVPCCLQVEHPGVPSSAPVSPIVDALESSVTCSYQPKEGSVLSVGAIVEQLPDASDENMWDDIDLSINFSSPPTRRPGANLGAPGAPPDG